MRPGATGARLDVTTGGMQMTTATREFTTIKAREIGVVIGIDWEHAPFDVEQFRLGLSVELEHGAHDPETNVTDDDDIVTGKIAWAHLKELPDYYTRLAAMEAEAEA
jgi:Protein of unknown function (DUF5661)